MLSSWQDETGHPSAGSLGLFVLCLVCFVFPLMICGLSSSGRKTFLVTGGKSFNVCPVTWGVKRVDRGWRRVVHSFGDPETFLELCPWGTDPIPSYRVQARMPTS